MSHNPPVPPTENHLWGDDWPQVRALWPLDPEVAHLNHGSFGATPTSVQQAQDRWRARMLANPMRYYLLDELVGIEQARHRAAAFLGGDPDGLVLVPNATTAVSTVLGALELRPGQRVVLTDHGYGAVRLAVERVAQRAGAIVTEVALPVDASDDQVVAAMAEAIDESTALVVVDEVTSATALRLPVARVVRLAQQRSVPTLVDAAHAPGQLAVDLGALGAEFWTGNLHKWPCAARGTAVLAVAPHWRARVEPLVTSWNHGLGFPAAHDLAGTRDHTGWLALGDALDAMAALGWDRLRAHGTALVAYGQQVVADAIGLRPDQVSGHPDVWMRALLLPAGIATTRDEANALWAAISDRLGCEVAVTTFGSRGVLRLSAHAYNAPADYERLAAGLPGLLAG